MPHELYNEYSKISSHNLKFKKKGNVTNNINLINTLNKPSLSEKLSKKIIHSMGTLGLNIPQIRLITEYENIEEMHGV